MKKKKKKKDSKAVRTPKNPILSINADKFAKLAFQSIRDTCE